jgi:hypothetical protein
METTNKTLPAAIIGISLILASLVGSVAFYKSKALANSLSVTGSAEQTITSDTAKWTASFSRIVDIAALKDGSVQMNHDLDAVRAYFKNKGVKNTELTIQPVTVSQVCESQQSVTYGKMGEQICGKVIGYNLSQQIIVESKDVQGTTKLAQEAPSAFIADGLVFTSQNLEYYYSKFADMKLDMIAAATKDAKARAERIADSTGVKLGPVMSASMGVFQVTALNSTDISDYGAYDTATIDKKVTAVVRASFSLK